MVAKKKKYARRVLKDANKVFPPGIVRSAYAPGLTVRLLSEILKTLRRIEKKLYHMDTNC